MINLVKFISGGTTPKATPEEIWNHALSNGNELSKQVEKFDNDDSLFTSSKTMAIIMIKDIDHPIINFLQNKKIGSMSYSLDDYTNKTYIINMKDYPALCHSSALDNRSVRFLINGMVDILKHYKIDTIGFLNHN